MENNKPTDTTYWIDSFNERLAALESQLNGLLDNLSTSQSQGTSIRSLWAEFRSSCAEFTKRLNDSEIIWHDKQEALEKRLQEMEAQITALKHESLPTSIGDKLKSLLAALEVDQKKFREEAQQLRNEHLGLKVLCERLEKFLENEKAA